MPSGKLVALTCSTVKEPRPTPAIELAVPAIEEEVLLILHWSSTLWTPLDRFATTKL